MEAEGWSLYCYRLLSPGPGRAQKTPEMDVSGRDKQNLKTGAPNFEKQKIYSIFKFEKKSLLGGAKKKGRSTTIKKNRCYLIDFFIKTYFLKIQNALFIFFFKVGSSKFQVLFVSS